MENTKWDKLWINANIASMADGKLAYGLRKNSAIASKNGLIVWIGRMDELDFNPAEKSEQVFDMGRKYLTPGFIDCHTHVVYAGSRAHEFEMRLKGVKYEDIAQRGGGIQSTVQATRQASEDELFEQSIVRVQSMMQEGLSVLEIKSGYGLNIESEIKMLRVAKRIGQKFNLHICSTFLGAHTVPKEYTGRSNDYVEYVCREMIPFIAEEKLAHAVDVFCEKIAFNLDQTEKIFQTAKNYNLLIKCHSEQLSNSNSAELAAEYGAISVDHLEYLSETGIKSLTKNGTTAVLLPGAFYFLRETKFPPIELLKSHNVPIAIATDCNPGTSPTTSLLLMMNMACTLFRLTPEEALAGVTKNAAKALGLSKTHGTLEVGKVDHIVSWDIDHPAELSYLFGQNPCHKIYR